MALDASPLATRPMMLVRMGPWRSPGARAALQDDGGSDESQDDDAEQEADAFVGAGRDHFRRSVDTGVMLGGMSGGSDCVGASKLIDGSDHHPFLAP